MAEFLVTNNKAIRKDAAVGGLKRKKKLRCYTSETLRPSKAPVPHAQIEVTTPPAGKRNALNKFFIYATLKNH